ncbi:maltose alpha-D-glucosyltransferase/alpha-amylase [Propionibacteriaceae bacterium ES.041]|nr:maltose alpha-D-glucosyltransferase/alpha-amylase [Propionibacteriaceae bacterium ES.041]
MTETVDTHPTEEPLLPADAGMDPTDHEWFKKAVFYEVLVRSFHDSNGDGIGDFAGLAEKLDYLQWLGVDCLWLPPFFPSPLLDGGYDVSDYTSVLPLLGTVDEFRQFVEGAHERGIRIIIDFVMNHTSDQHPWFQQSRSDPDGPYGDYYVWSDGGPAEGQVPEAYSDARIIFVDTEASNWTYDEVRGQYFWHRFYSHQPDLNFDNPKVLVEMLEAIRFWLRMGIDGFRLDAVPYLIEEDGTNCENLGGTHRILKAVRRMVDTEFPGRILLCEANQWPHDVVEYFGNDDECQMAFHFPVMPRLYMGLKQQSRACISEILADTPEIPPGCQWGTFLRNHDELTLEMVSEEDREYMWSEYAPDPRMKCNIGIRRRLAPLVDGDLKQVHLLHALLLGLPGSPVLYYGDEIGMGDNIWLHDRDGVRTPMQWSAEPGAGFSEAEEDSFHLPLVQDPWYAKEGVNVEQQMMDPGSLLIWLRAMLVIRRNHPVFGLGDFTDLGGANEKVFSFLRSHRGEDGTRMSVLCVNNLSPDPQTVHLDLSRFRGLVPFDLLRDDDHHPIDVETAHDYQIDIAGHGFLWLRIMADDPDLTEPEPTEQEGADDPEPS